MSSCIVTTDTCCRFPPLLCELCLCGCSLTSSSLLFCSYSLSHKSSGFASSFCRGYSSQWDVFFDQVEPLVTKMPYMTTIGNHERNWPNSGDRFPAQYDSGGECGVAYERRLQMPRPAEDKPWYSFDFGPIHFLQYSTEHVFAKGMLLEFAVSFCTACSLFITTIVIVCVNLSNACIPTLYNSMPV